MFRAFRRLFEPASDTHLGMALTLAALALALMLWAVVWQADIIEYQRQLIRTLLGSHLGANL
jgi:hypothetical protein